MEIPTTKFQDPILCRWNLALGISHLLRAILSVFHTRPGNNKFSKSCVRPVMVRLLFILLATLPLLSYGQVDSLAYFLEQLGKAETEADRLKADTAFHTMMIKALQAPNAFDEEFAQLEKIGRLTSSDNKLRLINWNVPLSNGKHRYRCLLLHKDRKGNVTLHQLNMPSIPRKSINARKALMPDGWYGALYYEIIPVRKGAKTYYTLLGWSGKDRLSTQKMVDVVHFSGKRPKLGAPIFTLEDGSTQYRMVFEYSEEVRMGLGFEEAEQRIVFDNLAPIHGDLNEQYQFYGPDGGYNALVWQKGKWSMQRNIEVRGSSDRPFNAPKPPDPDNLRR